MDDVKTLREGATLLRLRRTIVRFIFPGHVLHFDPNIFVRILLWKL